MGDRAYVVANFFVNGQTRTYDVSDPADMKLIEDIPEYEGVVVGRPVDIGGIDAEHDMTEGRLVVVGTTATNKSLPSNIHLFDVAGDKVRRVGIASLTVTAQEGTLVRFVVRGQYLYALTQYEGVQVVDMHKARDNFDPLARPPRGIEYHNMMTRLATDGVGFGRDAVLRTIPIMKNGTLHWIVADIDVAEYVVDDVRQPMAMVTGEVPLAVVNPQSGALQVHQGQEDLAADIGGAGALALGAVAGQARLAQQAEIARGAGRVGMGHVEQRRRLAESERFGERVIDAGMRDVEIGVR